MARRRRHRQDERQELDRETPVAVSRTPLQRLRSPRIDRPLLRLRELVRQVEDRRQYHPLAKDRPAQASRRAAARLVPSVTRKKTIPVHIRFAAPQQVAVCVRRHERREVLFAKGRHGAGNRSPRWSEFSHIKCK